MRRLRVRGDLPLMSTCFCNETQNPPTWLISLGMGGGFADGMYGRRVVITSGGFQSLWVAELGWNTHPSSPVSHAEPFKTLTRNVVRVGVCRPSPVFWCAWTETWRLQDCSPQSWLTGFKP